MASFDPNAPDREDPSYESYLADKIEEEETRLKSLQDKCRVTEMEHQLSQLRIKSAELEAKQPHGSKGLVSQSTPPATGIAASMLAVAQGRSPGPTADATPAPVGGQAGLPTAFVQRSREEKEMLSKLQALSHLSVPKSVEKVTYREFICSMTKVLKLITEFGIDPQNYVFHMSFIAIKAATNSYATDALISYEQAVTDRVISGQYSDWSAADPECVALHLGPDATYAIRQGGHRWNRQSSGNPGSVRDFSDWPKEVCWLFNNTSCYFQRCKKAHICVKCKKTGHAAKDCKTTDDLTFPTPTEITSPKGQKEARRN